MAIQTMCPHCGRGYTLAEAAAGQEVRCKGCGRAFTVEAPEQPAERPRPRRRRKEGGGVPVWVWLLLLGGGGLGFLAVGGVVAALLLWPGSGFSLTSRVSLENYEKLEVGMTEAELEQILGKPTERIDDFADFEKAVGIAATYVQMTPDVMMGDLLKNMRSSQIFSVCGLPDIDVRRAPRKDKADPDRWQVELRGIDALPCLFPQFGFQHPGIAQIPALRMRLLQLCDRLQRRVGAGETEFGERLPVQGGVSAWCGGLDDAVERFDRAIVLTLLQRVQSSVVGVAREAHGPRLVGGLTRGFPCRFRLLLDAGGVCLRRRDRLWRRFTGDDGLRNPRHHDLGQRGVDLRLDDRLLLLRWLGLCDLRDGLENRDRLHFDADAHRHQAADQGCMQGHDDEEDQLPASDDAGSFDC